MNVKVGNFISLKNKASIWRSGSESEKEVWLEEKLEIRDRDASGEFWLYSGTEHGDKEDIQQVFKVNKSRKVAKKDWAEVPKCCVVEDFTGTEWFVERRHIEEILA